MKEGSFNALASVKEIEDNHEDEVTQVKDNFIN